MVMPLPQTIGPYQIVEQVGIGGMATVYKAMQPRLERVVAVKVMHQAFLQDPNFRARFEREARIVARLEHPNIVPVYDYDEVNGQPYLVMKYISGETLKDVLRKGPLPLAAILDVMPRVADALTFAHAQGVLHRDIKPSNILIDEAGQPYLTDFGLARITQLGESTMSADMMLGTPHYISPEQAQGLGGLDSRTDVYSLGVILYELVTGRVPFMGDTTYAIVHKHIYAAPPPPSQLNPEIPAQVEQVLLRALEKQPAARYDTPTALMAAFQEAVRASGLRQLDESRVEVAAHAAVPEFTPGGGSYTSIPSPIQRTEPLPGEQRLNEFFRQMAERVQQIADDMGRDLKHSETWHKIAEKVRENVQVETTERGMQIRFGVQTPPQSSASTSTQTPQAPKRPAPPPFVVPSAAREHKRRARTVRIINRDWGTDEDAIRRRVSQRAQERAGLLVHTIAYIIIAILLTVFEVTFTEALLSFLSEAVATDPNVPAQFATPAFADAVRSLPLAVILLLPWLSGLIAHALSVFYRSGRRLDARRRALHESLLDRYGPNWQETIDAPDYKRIRQSVEERFEKRLGFFTHAIGTVFLILTLFAAWPGIVDMAGVFATDGLPPLMLGYNVPVIGTIFMLVALLFHGVVIGFDTLIGAEATERAIDREIARERERLARTQSEKAKRDDLDGAAAKRKIEQMSPRLTEDGELTDSFLIDLEDEQRRTR